MAQPAQPRKPLLSHISLGVTSMYRSETFYNAVLAALDIKQVYRDVNDRRKTAGVCGWGHDTGKGEDEEFTLFLRPGASPPGPGSHIAFNAPSRSAVDAFHAAALAHGGTDDGAPGVRTEVSEDYYACFVKDPEGWRVEAVFQGKV